MNSIVHSLVHYVAVPGHWLNTLLHISGIGLVQYSVGLLVTLVGLIFTCTLAAHWRSQRHLLYLISAIVSLAAGGIFALATVSYTSAWLYTGLLALIFLDLSWHTIRKHRGLRLVTVLWTGFGILTAILVCAGTWTTIHFTEGQSGKTLTTSSSTAVSKIQALKATTAVAVEKVASTTLTNIDLTALASQSQLNFLTVKNALGTLLASSSGAPLVTLSANNSRITVDSRGTPLVAATATTANGDIVTGGVFLDSTRLTLLGLKGGIISNYQLESSAGLSGNELLAAGSADTRTWVSDGKAHSFSTETTTDRVLLQSSVLDETTSLQFISLSTDQYAVQRERGLYGVVVLAVAALIILLALFFPKLRKAILPIGIFGGMGCVIIGIYCVWVVMAYSALHAAFPLTTIRLNHPAITPVIYFHANQTGLSLQIDTGGANIASVTGQFSVPAGIKASDVVLDPNFCTTVQQAPQVTLGILSFSCSTPDPASKNQIAILAQIIAASNTVSGGTFALVTGSASARTGDTTTEILPMRAVPLTPAAATSGQ